MEPAAIRYKNPGAMWPNKIATKWGSVRWVYLNDGTGQGGNGKGNKIAIFGFWVQGICAQLDLWRSSQNYRNKTLAAALKIWSGGNHVEAYIAHVIRRIPSMTRDTVMNDAFWSGPNGIKFLQVQAAHEAGRAMPVADAEWLEAQKRVMSGAPPKVATTKQKGTVAAGGGTSATVTAAHGGFPLWVAVLIGLGVAVAIFVIWKYKQSRIIKADLPAVAFPPPVDVTVAVTTPTDNAGSEQPK
jgi:hypothetical protein